MALNGISTLPTKEERLIAKLALAQEKKLSQNVVRAYTDITLLPTQYSGNNVIGNPNTGGLIAGRPWTSSAPIPEFDNPELTVGSAVSIVESSPFVSG